MGRRLLRRVLRRGSKKGLSRRHLEGRSTPFQEYVGVCPIPLGAILLHTVFCLGELFSEISTGTLQHEIPGGRISYCNVRIGAVLPWKPRIIRLQYTVSLPAPCGN